LSKKGRILLQARFANLHTQTVHDNMMQSIKDSTSHVDNSKRDRTIRQKKRAIADHSFTLAYKWNIQRMETFFSSPALTSIFNIFISKEAQSTQYVPAIKKL
jgi:protein subunit release factor A